jgi:hypothetical protein
MPYSRTTEAVNQPHPRSRPVRTATITIYATFLLLVVAIPQSAVNWLRDMKGSEVQEMLLCWAEVLQTASRQTGIAIPYIRARAVFLELLRKEGN